MSGTRKLRSEMQKFGIGHKYCSKSDRTYTMDRRTMLALVRVVDEYIGDEYNHWVDTRKPKGHIYKDIEKVDRFIANYGVYKPGG